MSAYDKKSFEELRLEDYMAGNKGSKGQAAPTSTFGAPAAAPAGGLFGSPTPAPAFGAAPAPSGGLFGSAPAPAFGAAPAPSGGLFGAPAPATGGGFSFGATPAPAPSTGLFGSTPAASAPSGGLFGAPAPAPSAGGGFSFGATPAPAPSTGLFGSTPAAPAPSGGLFGAPAPAPSAGGGFSFGATPAPAPSTGLFGSTPAAPAPSGGLFGAPAPAPSAGGGFSFSATPAAAPGGFGASPAAAAPSGGLFGSAPAPSGGLFGASAPAPSGGLFGAPAPSAGGLFGAPAPAPSGGLFGAPAPAPGGGLFGAPKPAGGGIFGAPAPAGGMFGAPAPATTFGSPQPVTSAFGASVTPGMTATATTVLVPPSADTLLAQQLAAVETQRKEMAVLDAMRGSSPGNINGSSSAKVIPTSIYQRDAAAVRYRGLASGSGSSQPATSYTQNLAPRSTAKVRPRGFGPPTPPSGFLISNARNNARSTTMAPSAFLGSCTKHLVIKPGSLTPKPKVRLLLTDEPFEKSNLNGNAEKDSNDLPSTNTSGVIRGSAIENGAANTPASEKNTSSPSPAQESTPYDVTRIADKEAAFRSPEAVATNQRESSRASKSSTKKKTTPTANSEAYDYYKTIIGSPPASEVQNKNKKKQTSSKLTLVPKLTKENYVTSPSIKELGEMSEVELATVSNFVVERVGIGSVAWDGAVDIRGIDLDSIISIEERDISVYLEQEKLGTKPSVGTKLNRPAVLTFHHVYPKGGGSQASLEGKFQEKLEKSTEAMGAEFIKYDSTEGIWAIKVPHFSRYAFVDDSEDEKEQVGESETSKKDFDSGVGGGPARSINEQLEKRQKKKARLSRIRAPSNEDDDMEEYIEEPIIGMTKDSGDNAIRAAEAAYAKMTEMRSEMSTFGMMDMTEKRSKYSEGCEIECEYNTHPPAPVVNPREIKNTFSVCKELAKRCGIKEETSSKTDYSMRMGRSFNTGWRPDGLLLSPSFLNGTRNDEVIQSRPAMVSHKVTSNLLSAHLQNSVNIFKDGEIPVFALPARSKNSNVGDDSILSILDNYESICTKYSEEHTDDPVNNTISQSLALIQILFGNATFDDPRQKSKALSTWLRFLCAKNVERDITAAKGANSCHAAIFAALSGGDMNKASSLALENGLINLSVIITHATLQASTDISIQMHSWSEYGSLQHMPLHLQRIYTLLSRDLELENSLYERSGPTYEQSLDWKRRLTMLEACTGGNIESSNQSLIASLLNKYDDDVNAGKAPPANAWYNNSRHPRVQQEKKPEECILYRLMKVFKNVEAGNSEDFLSYVVSPYGHTNDPHDTSFSFHLAAILSALQVNCKPISQSEECRLLEGYALYLINDGYWELAIYVILCTFRENNITVQDIEWKKKMAIDILCKHYPNDVDSKERREFLETKVGIPSYWFDRALSYQSESFHQQGNNNSIVDYSTNQAVAKFEATVLPTILFDGDKEKCDALVVYLEEIYDGLGESSSLSLGGLVLDYLKVSQAMLEYSLNDGLEGSDINFDDMLTKAEQIQSALPKLQEIADSDISFSPSTVPRHVTIAELESAVILLVVQLNVLKRGGLILETNKVYERYKLKALKIMSKLEYILSHRNEQVPLPSGHQAGSSIIRGKCGMEIET